MKAFVIGGTGAVGRELVGELLSSDKWSKVTVVSRKPIEVPEYYKDKANLQKLDNRVLSNLDNIPTDPNTKGMYAGVDAAFCTLGTTRAVAGSAANFKKVDYEYVVTSAKMAKEAGVKHYSLCTAVGSNPNVPACDWKIFHGLLYMKTKGLAEEAVKALGFATTSIFRPGMLERGELTRGTEKFWSMFMPSTHVRTVARAMMLDAENNLATAAAAKSAAKVYEEKAIQTFPGVNQWREKA